MPLVQFLRQAEGKLNPPRFQLLSQENQETDCCLLVDIKAHFSRGAEVLVNSLNIPGQMRPLNGKAELVFLLLLCFRQSADLVLGVHQAAHLLGEVPHPLLLVS